MVITNEILDECQKVIITHNNVKYQEYLNIPNHVNYINELGNLKSELLQVFSVTIAQVVHTFYFCRFTEPAFILSFTFNGINVSHTTDREKVIPYLTPKEQHFILSGYMSEKWIETQDFRKAQSIFLLPTDLYSGQFLPPPTDPQPNEPI